MNPIFRDLRQFLHIVALMSEVLPPNLQLHTPSFVFTGRFYKVFGRYLLCCVRIALDRIQLLGHQLDWTGLGSVTRGFGLDWIASTQSISYSGGKHVVNAPNPYTKFEHNRPGRSRDAEARCARAHVQRYPTHDLWKAHTSWPTTHSPNLNTIGQAVPEIQKRGVHVRTCRRRYPAHAFCKMHS